MTLQADTNSVQTSKNTAALGFLNGNSFFSLDYEGNEDYHNAYSLHNNFISRFMAPSKHLFNSDIIHSSPTNSNVKSAQYSRKNENANTLYKIDLPPSTSIKLKY